MKRVAIAAGAIAGLIVIALLILVALGHRSGAGVIAGSIEIDRAPAEVWPWIVEGERQKQWVSWLTEVHELTPGREGVGARVQWVMIDPTTNNQRVVINSEVVELDPPRHSRVSLESPGMFTGTGSYTLTDLGNGRTRVEYVSEYWMSSWFWQLMEPMVTPSARRKAAEDLARLKEQAEATWTSNLDVVAPHTAR